MSTLSVMTGREVASLLLVLAGFVASSVGAGWFHPAAGLFVAGVHLVALGVLLGLGE